MFILEWNDTKETFCSKTCGSNAFKNITNLCSHTKDTCIAAYGQNEAYCVNGGCPTDTNETFQSPCHFEPCQGKL